MRSRGQATLNPLLHIEWHFLLNGLTGFSVNMDVGWDNYRLRFFKYVFNQDVLNNANITDNIFLMVIVERHVAGGNKPRSVNAFQRSHFYRQKQKYMRKERLRVLIRCKVARNHAASRHTLHGSPMPQPSQAERRLDTFLDALADKEGLSVFIPGRYFYPHQCGGTSACYGPK
jgi:hypothetical protein